MTLATLTLELLDDPMSPRAVTVRGRDAWALLELQRAGNSGCTAINTPGPRWSGYVHKLRRKGIVIATIDETHGGRFPGRHARYVLRSHLRIVADADAMEVA